MLKIANRKLFSTFSILLMALLTVLLMVALVFPTFAAPNHQDDPNLPTPTPQPVEDVAYTLSKVGGQAATFTLPAFEKDGISIGETTVESHYPAGMIFTMTASSANGDITNATLYIELTSGSRNRVPADLDADTNTWTAHLWDTGGQPAWAHFKAWWSVVDAANVGVETEGTFLDYADPNREWWRVETDDIIMYWYEGGLAGTPDEIAAQIAEAMAATEQRRVEGFGGRISYKPIGVVYANDQDLGEMYASGTTNPNAAGFTSSDLGMTVQDNGNPPPEWFENLKDCIYLTPLEARTLEWRTQGTIYSTIPHEVAHLYQYDKGVLLGPTWWVEGQADWFSYAPGQYDKRLRHLATLQDLTVSLDGDNVGWVTTEADGCYGLAYDVGVSFINWLMATYGGLPTHAAILQNLRSGQTLYQALETVTGKTFLELENEWRAYIGFNVLSLADVDPASALDDPIDAAFAVGDTVTLPAMPMQVPMADAPGPGQIGNAPCFGGTEVTILRVGSLDGVNYYEVDCGGLTGWMTLGQLQAQ